MGPRRWRRGDRENEMYSTPNTQLQWGHAGGGVETPWAMVRSADDSEASMGPRRWRRGDTTLSYSLICAISSFNGATPVEAWRPLQGSSIRQRMSCFNGATPVEAWRHRLSGRERWGILASMGPRRWRRGDRQEAPYRAPFSVCFNGATPVEAWRRQGGAECRGRKGGFNGATPVEAWRRNPCVEQKNP